MKRSRSMLVVAALFALTCTVSSTSAPATADANAAAVAQEGVGAAHVAQLLKAIAGKKDLPSEQVFKNIQIFKGVPAERLVRIMQASYSESLGISCDHCHVEEQWDSDERRPKRAAREMAVLVTAINKQLETMQHIDGETPTPVNCSTCHRGELKPSNRRTPG